MNTYQFSRTEMILGKEAMKKLAHARVAIFGIGGVGGYAAEALVRSGVGKLDFIDHDKVSLSNLNRQIIATHETIGRYKVDAMKERAQAINPDCQITTHKCFFLPENKAQFNFTEYDYIIDAVDTVTAKIQLVMQAQEAGAPIISSMGAGNKLNPAAFEVADIYKTSVCPLAKAMRRELKKRGVKKLKVVYSKEAPIRAVTAESELSRDIDEPLSDSAYSECSRRPAPGSIAFVPSVAGLMIASEVVKDLANY